MTKFEIGKKYYMRSACDHECIWKFTVIARTAKMITLMDEHGKERKCKVSNMGTISEAVFPLGRYSMCPMLNAERIC